MAHLRHRAYVVSAPPLPRSWSAADAIAGSAAVAWVLALGLLVLPHLAFPLQDEVHYVGPTVWLANTGQLVLPTTTASFVVLAAWGAAFVKFFGGDFATLRLAAVVASALAAVTFYGLLQELGFGRARSALALGVLVLNPLYLATSAIFLTESLFVLLVLGSLWAGLLGLRRSDGVFLLIAAALGSLAFLTRQLGILVIVALAAGLLANSEWRRSPRPWLLLLGLPALIVPAYLLWSAGAEGAGSRSYFASLGTMWTQELHLTHLGRRLNMTLPYIGLFMLPLLLVHFPAFIAGLRRLDRWGTIAALGGGLFAMAGYAYEWTHGFRHFPYLGNTLDPRGLFMNDFTVIRQWQPEAWVTAGTLAAWAAAGIGLGLALRALPRSPRLWWGHPDFPVYLTLVLLILATISGRMLIDRYLFPWLPFVLILALIATRGMRPSLAVATVLAAALVVVDVALMVDYDHRAMLRWEMGRDLVESGIPAEQIDASWEWHWWWGYWQVYRVGEGPPHQTESAVGDQSASAALREMQRQSRSLLPDPERPYRVAASPEPGYAVERTYSYWTPLGWKTRELYVLRATSAH